MEPYDQKKSPGFDYCPVYSQGGDAGSQVKDLYYRKLAGTVCLLMPAVWKYVPDACFFQAVNQQERKQCIRCFLKENNMVKAVFAVKQRDPGLK